MPRGDKAEDSMADWGELNTALVRTSYETVDLQARSLLRVSFEIIGRLLLRDRIALEKVDLRKGEEAELYIAPGLLEALWRNGRPQTTLTCMLESQQNILGDTQGDRLYVSLPTGNEYTYPQPLGETAPPQAAYVHYLPSPRKDIPANRYVIRPGDVGENYLYRLYHYTSKAETRRQIITDDMSDTKIAEITMQQIPEELTVMNALFTAFGNFRVMPQTRLSAHGKTLL